MINLRSSIEAIVKNKNISKKSDATFEFGGEEWATQIVKKLLATFTNDQAVVVSIGEKNEKPIMVFKWANGDAFIYCVRASKVLRKEELKGSP